MVFPLEVVIEAVGVADGLSVMLRVCAGPVPQELVAVTETVPDTEPKSTVMAVVPWPEVMVEPAGANHVYEEAPETSAML